MVGCAVTTRLVVALSAVVLILAAVFYFGFTLAGLGAAVCLGAVFYSLAPFLLVIISGCLGASVTDW